MKRIPAVLISVVVITAVSACSDKSSPTGPSEALEAQTRTLDPTFQTSVEGSRTLSESNVDRNEEFNCKNIEFVHVRFGHPGWVDGNSVGLFVEFRGMPAGEKIVRIWWDVEGNPDSFEDVDITDALVPSVKDGLFDWDRVLEHTYDSGSKSYRVRVELLSTGATGNCARVRDVSVSPLSSESRFTRTMSGSFDCATGTGTFFGTYPAVDISTIKRIHPSIHITNVTGGSLAFGVAIYDALPASAVYHSPTTPTVNVGESLTTRWTARVPADINFDPSIGHLLGSCFGAAFDWTIRIEFVRK